MNKIVAICGPTAVGKTAYSIEIAKRFDGEIVSCDSMQLYKYMDIGSAKPSPDELNQVKHHLIGVVEPSEMFSVAKYKELANDAIDDIISRGKLPIIAGGTGLYLDALLFDLDFAAAPSDDSLRDELYKIAEEKGNLELHAILNECDPDSAKRIHPNNVRRVVRAIESAKSGNKLKDFAKDLSLNDKYEFILIGLRRDREELYERINRRVDILVEEGLFEEVKMLREMGLSESDISMKGIGYKEVLAYFDGEYDLETAIDTIKKNTRHFAKRQITWLKRYDDMKWFDLSESKDDKDSIRAGKKLIISNKSNKPDNIVMHEAEIYSKCEEFEALMPRFMRSFFIYLRGNVLPMTRLAYLRDINFFFEYLINQTDLTSAEKVADIKASELAELKAMDINLFLMKKAEIHMFTKIATRPWLEKNLHYRLCSNSFIEMKYSQRISQMDSIP